MRYDNPEGGGAAEEHMLERVSVLENRLGRLTDRMERALDLLLRQAQNSYLDRALLKSLIGLLDADGIVENPKARAAMAAALRAGCRRPGAEQPTRRSCAPKSPRAIAAAIAALSTSW